MVILIPVRYCDFHQNESFSNSMSFVVVCNLQEKAPMSRTIKNAPSKQNNVCLQDMWKNVH